MIFGLIILRLVGISVATFGLSGRIVSTDPHCRKCRFDLIGVNLSKVAARCPECGSTVSNAAAVQQGLRRRRPRALIAGMVLILISLAGGGAVVYNGAQGFNWNTVKPAWLLLRELGNSDQTVSIAAMKEFDTRLTAGSLNADRASEIMKRALARQADPNAVWFVAWGNYLESCRARGLMSPGQLQSYARHAPSITVEARPQVAQDSPLTFRVKAGGGRVGDKSSMTLTMKNIETSEGGRIINTLGGGGSMGLGTMGWGSLGSTVKIPGPPGTRTFTSKWHFGVTQGSADSPPVVAWDQAFDVAVTVVPAGTTDVELVVDDALRPAVEAAITATDCEVYPAGQSSQRAGGMIHASSPPIGLAYDVYWRAMDGSAEWKLGSVVFSRGVPSAGFGYGGDLPKDFKQTQVDVLLRPSVRAATVSLDIFKIWGGELIRTGLPVRLPKPVESPN